MKFNAFRILGDVSHTLSKVILIWAIHRNSSAEGVSLITQVLYALVFCSRYLDIFTTSATSDGWHIWNFTLKIFYTLSSFYIIFLMTSVYPRTREREKAWSFSLYILLGSIIITPIWHYLLKYWEFFTYADMSILWEFSEILESVCALPQLLLLRQTTVPTVIDSFYLVALGLYRFLYVLNWIQRRRADKEYSDPTSWVWGSIQTALMIDFAWVYWTRQRVKLRNGGVVDSDDLGRGWIFGRFIKRMKFDSNPDEGTGGREDSVQPSNRWSRHGISVSADEDIESQPLADPTAFEDNSEDDDTPPLTTSSGAHDSGVRGDEWVDDLDDDAAEHGSTIKHA